MGNLKDYLLDVEKFRKLFVGYETKRIDNFINEYIHDNYSIEVYVNRVPKKHYAIILKQREVMYGFYKELIRYATNTPEQAFDVVVALKVKYGFPIFGLSEQISLARYERASVERTKKKRKK